MSNVPQYYRANRGVMTRFLPRSYRRVLEVGCGAGDFYDHLQQPCEVWGIEPNPEAAKAASIKLHRVLIGRYDQMADQLPDGYYDLIICNDVIEHMDDHDLFLEEIKKKLLPGGVIVGSIPNIRHITALFKILITKNWRYSDSGILDRTHLRFFTERSLRHTLLDHGYLIQMFGGVGSVIRHGIIQQSKKPSFLKNIGYQGVAIVVVLLTLGYYWDTQYPQYAFRIKYE
jgi:2-polyprenyl-3-methyl-5-hydroxy-6-metoxy-1,4-benzoquinol methylase